MPPLAPAKNFIGGCFVEGASSFLPVMNPADGSMLSQVPLSDAQALYDAAGSKDKTLRVFTEEEGGAQHCQRDYLTLVVATMWDWFEDKLKP